jgi:predicted acetyltransferase
VPPSTNVEVVPARSAEKPLLASMLESHLVELEAPKTYPYFEDYWSEPTRHPFIIRCADQVAGFAFVRRLQCENALEMAEFYIAPKFRRSGVGRAAATTIFAEFPGQWRIAVLAPNTIGALFWSSVVPSKAPPLIEGGRMVFSFSANGEHAV